MLHFSVREYGGICATAVLASMLCGCGGSADYKVAPVTGTVLCNGQPVPGGFVFLTPVDDPDQTGRRAGFAGKSAVGVVGADGTFMVGTYSERDGALIGPHKIRFEFPELPESEAEWSELEPADAERLRGLENFACRAGVDVEKFDVVAGNNELTINLTEK
jgi:hypothetical protein